MQESRYHKYNKLTSFSKVNYICMNARRLNDNYALTYAMNYAKDYNIEIDYLLINLPLNERYNTIQAELLNKHNNEFTNNELGFKPINNLLEFIKAHDDELIVIDMPYYYDEYHLLAKYSNIIMVDNNTYFPLGLVLDKCAYNKYQYVLKINKQATNYRVANDLYSSANITSFEQEALVVLDKFITENLKNYHLSNDPTKNYTSRLSMYLHFGFISPQKIVEVLNNYTNKYPELMDNASQFFDQVIYFRELAHNFTFYNSQYASLESIPNWAKVTISEHLSDNREYLYDINDYLSFNTHDIYFNESMKLLVNEHYIPNYMRMYWGKKIIEWSSSYVEAFNTLLKLNNDYMLDGYDPNGYVGVLWCFGLHDRAWKERPILGKLRYMNSNGLERKFNMEDYKYKKTT